MTTWPEVDARWRLHGHTTPFLREPPRIVFDTLWLFAMDDTPIEARASWRERFWKLTHGIDPDLIVASIVDDVPALAGVPVPDWWDDDNAIDWGPTGSPGEF